MLHGHLRALELPLIGAKVLAVREGTLDLHGRPVGDTWHRLGATAAAGASQITLKVPVDWRVGDEVVLATTGDRHSQKENEKRKISGQRTALWPRTGAQPKNSVADPEGGLGV